MVVIIPTKDNVESLCATLMSLRNQGVKRIVISDNGTVPIVGHSMLSFVSAILDYEGIDLIIKRAGRVSGDSATRWNALKEVAGAYESVMTLDDDIIVWDGALKKLKEAFNHEAMGFICGSTLDPVNNRGFADYTLKPQPLADNPKMHFYYEENDIVVPVNRAPTGFTLWNFPLLKGAWLEKYDRFFENGVPGSDLLMSQLMIEKKPGFFHTGARCWHLFKGTQNWNPGHMMEHYVKRIREQL